MWEDTEIFCKRGEEGYWKRGGGGIFRGGIAIPGIPENLNVSSTESSSWRKEGSKGKEMHLEKIGWNFNRTFLICFLIADYEVCTKKPTILRENSLLNTGVP